MFTVSEGLKYSEGILMSGKQRRGLWNSESKNSKPNGPESIL